ncbi:hypothetical protein HDF15_003892 [Granulicella mallensis]|jgi:hypothetical protein|uniref:Uncharacterized protein n=1 Tax=Granulicella mallensis TaxID=940614 RepID=A0A7W8EBF4_9BACT|nr:hypothetical protein [Granulicella mallensis]
MVYENAPGCVIKLRSRFNQILALKGRGFSPAVEAIS